MPGGGRLWGASCGRSSGATDHPQPRPRPPAPPSPSLQPELSHVPALPSDPTCAGSCASPLATMQKGGRCLANEATVTTWTLGEEVRTFRTSQHPQCGVMPMVRAVWGREGDLHDNGYSHSPAASGPWTWLRLAFCSRPRRAQSLALRPEPPGTPGPFPSFPHPIHLHLQAVTSASRKASRLCCEL